MSKTTKNWKKTDNLENEVREHEKELEAIKEALEKNNMNALNNLQIKNIPKSSRFSGKLPKRLTDKEKERRDEIRRLKEVEGLDKIQQQLFKQVRGRRKIDPLDKKILTTNRRFMDNDDIFAMNLNKECERILGKENSKQPIPNKTMANAWRNKSKNDKKILRKNNAYPLSAINRKNKTKEKNKKKILTDEEKDEEYLAKLNKEIKQFYMEKTKEIFDFLKEIYLCRYIDCFLKEGYDIFEEFIALPKDFFDKMEKPFLNKEQQEKLYNKLSIFNNKKNEEIEKEKNNNGGKLKSKTQQNFNKKSQKYSSNIISNLKENNNKEENILNENNNISNNNNKNINDTSPLIAKEEILNNNFDIVKLEKQREEEFKKAVKEWRNNNNSNNLISTPSNEQNNKINQESNAPVNNSSLLINTPNDIVCCWNCFKPIKKENATNRVYKNKYENSILFENKNFCNLKCIKEYEKKKKTIFVCFHCNKVFDLYKGFISHDGEKFCSTKCKENFIEIENSILKNNNNEKKKEKNKKKKNEIPNKIISNDLDYYEGDDYDPMDDF